MSNPGRRQRRTPRNSSRRRTRRRRRRRARSPFRCIVLLLLYKRRHRCRHHVDKSPRARRKSSFSIVQQNDRRGGTLLLCRRRLQCSTSHPFVCSLFGRHKKDPSKSHKNSTKKNSRVHIILDQPMVSSLLSSSRSRSVASSSSSSSSFTSSSSSFRGKKISPRARRTLTAEKEQKNRIVVTTSASSSSQHSGVLLELAAKKAPVVAAKPTMCATVAANLSASSALAFPTFTAVAILPVTLAYINPVYSFSVGYGLSVAASAGLLLKSASISGIILPQLCQLHLFGGLLYGLRLGIFLAIRSKTWKDWGKRAEASPEAQNSKSLLQRTMVIVGCGFIYALMASPMLFHYQNANVVAHHEILKAGVVMQYVGLVLEAVADQWKYQHYRKNEGKFCQTGPYAFCRHPNYLGEMLFWLGLYIAGVPAMMTKWSSFIPASIGCAFIMWLMTMASKRGDKKALEKYGDAPEYKEYRAKSCSLVPGF